MLVADSNGALGVPEIEPLTACFGVACLAHGDCARYAAVGHSEASPTTLGTCLSGRAYPLFVRISESARERTTPRGDLSEPKRKQV
jgi:hypothetical protein